MSDPQTRLAASAKLPSGRTIEMLEITGSDELFAAAQCGEEGRAARIRENWALIQRSIVSIDGERLEQSATTPETFRARFSAKDWAAVQMLFDQVHNPTKDEISSFRSGIRFQA